VITEGGGFASAPVPALAIVGWPAVCAGVGAIVPLAPLIGGCGVDEHANTSELTTGKTQCLEPPARLSERVIRTT
jgi:hypothetical protein